VRKENQVNSCFYIKDYKRKRSCLTSCKLTCRWGLNFYKNEPYCKAEQCNC